MKVYFTASIRGGRTEQPTYKYIVEMLQHHASVLSTHVADETLSFYGETEYAPEEIYEREIKKIEDCDLLIAEVTVPSLGVGYAIGKALELGKKIFCFYHGKNTDRLSAMISGNSNLTLSLYTSTEDINHSLEEIFSAEN